mmetsp:Transcript_78883/g.205714  ORF Transcript_78883/g.205714 Transcript_78883/m.205714 type:complete len:210 (-) Transcript_78883:1071-1700(-)
MVLRSGMPTLPCPWFQRPANVRKRLDLPTPDLPMTTSRAGPSSPPSLRSRFSTSVRSSGVRTASAEMRTSWSAVVKRLTLSWLANASTFRRSPVIRFAADARFAMVCDELLMNEKQATTLARLRPTCATTPTSSLIWKNNCANITHGTMVPPAVKANENEEKAISHEIFSLRACIRSAKKALTSASTWRSPAKSAMLSALSRTWTNECR